MSHWLDRVITLLNAETNDLRELARIAGFDPQTFYLGTALNRADLRGQNLQGMTFTPHALEGAILDSNTKLDENKPSSTLDLNRDITTLPLEYKKALDFARSLIDSGQLEDAAYYLQQHEDEFRHYPEFQELLGNTLFKMNYFFDALRIFITLKNGAPAERRIKYALMLIKIYVAVDNVAVAQDIAVETIRPLRGSALKEFLRRLQKYRNGFHILSGLLPILPTLGLTSGQTSRIIDTLVRVLVELDRHDDAMELIERFAPHFSETNSAASIRLAKLLMKVQSAGKAAEILLEAVARNPENVGTSVLLARALHADHRTTEAADVLRRAIVNFPRDPGLWNVLGELLFEAGKFAEAEEVFCKASVRFQDDGLSRRYEALRSRDPGKLAGRSAS